MPIDHSSLSSVPLDPYLDWAIRTDFRHQRPGDWIPLLVRFDLTPRGSESDSGTALQRFTSLAWLDARLKKSVRVPELLLEPPRAIAQSKAFNFCVLFVAKKDIAAVTNSSSWRAKIVSMTFSPPFDPPQPEPAAPVTESAPPLSLLRRVAEFFRRLFGGKDVRRTMNRQAGAVAPFGWPALGALPQHLAVLPPGQGPGPAAPVNPAVVLPRTVAVIVLDEGIAFAHDCFRTAAGTRIQFLWDQNGRIGTPVGTVTFGTQLTAAQIDSEVAMHPSGPNGEESVYRALRALDFSRDEYKPFARRRTHGTHVASIACKMAPGILPAQRPIVAVELPEQAIADPAGSNLYAYIFLGMVYAMARVQNDLSSGGPMPMVCNISYGPHTGPHDGTNLFEDLVDFLIRSSRQTPWPLEVVLAAGNSRQTRAHAALKVLAGRSKSLLWRVQPQDVLPNFVELWCPLADIGSITVTATSPLGASRSVSMAQPQNNEAGPNGPVFWMWITPWNPLVPPSRVQILIGIQPTTADPPLASTLPVAPSGVWTITVASQRTVKIEAWIGRKVGSKTRRGVGRQPYFDDPNYRRFQSNTMPQEYDPAFTSSYVRRTGTLSGIATGQLTHVVGACYRSTSAPTRYTSMGPTSGGTRTAPDPTLLAVAEDSIVLHGVLAAGTRGDCVVAMNGTSVAAPQYAQWLAEQLATMPVIGIPFVPVYNPPVTAPPAGTPPFVAGLGCLVYPTTWYRVARPDRPTYC